MRFLNDIEIYSILNNFVVFDRPDVKIGLSIIENGMHVCDSAMPLLYLSVAFTSIFNRISTCGFLFQGTYSLLLYIDKQYIKIKY